MKKLSKIIVSALCAAALTLPLFATACGKDKPDEQEQHTHVDYVSDLKLDFTSNTKKQQVTVKKYIDGDTTHFNPVPNSKLQGCNNAADFSSASAPKTTKGFAKARYLSINTPESTGQIEPWGGAASKFTKSKLEKATSIIIESNDSEWHIDNTGERYLLWIWYVPEGETEYRNLNVEILQEGLAFGSGTTDEDNRYSEASVAALEQAQTEKLYVYSKEQDPDYWYGGPINIDMRELRFNTEAYDLKTVVIRGTVVANFNNTAYIEETYTDIDGYEDGIRLGMSVYYGFTTGKVLEILSVGNYVSVVGTVKFDDWSGAYQITNIQAYDRYNKNNPTNCNLLEVRGLDNAYTEIDVAEFISTKETVSWEVNKKDEDGEDYSEVVSLTYADALLGSSVTVSNVTVTKVNTTETDTTSKGAMTLTCRDANDNVFKVRTEVLKDSEGNTVTASAYLNKTITVKGVVEKFSGTYQIKCYRTDYITVVG